MSYLNYRGSELYLEDVSLKSIAEQCGTPCYIYSRAAIETNWHAFDDAFRSISHRVCYAVKANSNIGILSVLAKLNSGFDIVSLGELERVLVAGGDPRRIVFSGIGKTQLELERAILEGIYCIDVESEPELERLHAIAARHKKTVDVAFRINPNINPQTHSHISTGLKENKFGIDYSEVMTLAGKLPAMPALRLCGIACHIGSQIVDIKPFLLAIDRLLEIYQQLEKSGFNIRHINIGGGLGIIYRDEQPPAIQDYANALREKIGKLPVEIIIEPGRAIVGNAGILLTRVEYVKHNNHKNFAIVDAGMNDLLRPALYDAWQNILPVELRDSDKKTYDIVGPVCESADILGKNRELSIHGGDLLAVTSAGAYGFSMSSNYNSRCRAAEVLVDKNKIHLIRRRETMEELFASESVL